MTQTAWSFSGTPATDIEFRQKSQRAPLADYLRAYETVSSDANLQVTAIAPNGPHSVMDMRFFQGATGEYGGRVKRPAMAYRWQGYLPYVAAYVLVPFRGVRDTPYAKVKGSWSPAGDLAVTVRLPQGAVFVTAKGLQAARPKPAFSVRHRTHA